LKSIVIAKGGAMSYSEKNAGEFTGKVLSISCVMGDGEAQADEEK